MKNIHDFTGFSELGISEALQNALIKAGNPTQFEVIETLGFQEKGNRQYAVTLKTCSE